MTENEIVGESIAELLWQAECQQKEVQQLRCECQQASHNSLKGEIGGIYWGIVGFSVLNMMFQTIFNNIGQNVELIHAKISSHDRSHKVLWAPEGAPQTHQQLLLIPLLGRKMCCTVLPQTNRPSSILPQTFCFAISRQVILGSMTF